MNDRLEGFNPCPLCGSKDEMFVTSERTLKQVLEDYGITRITVSCERCCLLIGNDDENKSYADRRKNLMTKWNSLKGASHEAI